MHLFRIFKITRLKTRISIERNARRFNDIDNNFTSTHFNLDIFSARETPARIFKRGQNYARVYFIISNIPRLKTRLWHIANRETMQWKKTT